MDIQAKLAPIYLKWHLQNLIMGMSEVKLRLILFTTGYGWHWGQWVIAKESDKKFINPLELDLHATLYQFCSLNEGKC